jgi:hypothetical protein
MIVTLAKNKNSLKKKHLSGGGGGGEQFLYYVTGSKSLVPEIAEGTCECQRYFPVTNNLKQAGYET